MQDRQRQRKSQILSNLKNSMNISKKRIFYGVHLKNAELSSCIAMIRYLTEPGFYRPTHITIRGPYERSLSSRVLSQINKRFEPQSRYVEIVGSGTFFLGKQNTIILKCEIPGVKDVWNKPSFADGVPHITLYDGSSRSDALAINHVVKNHDWSLIADVTEIVELESKLDPRFNLLPQAQESRELQHAVFEGQFIVTNADQMPLLDRLVLLERVCRYTLKRFGRKTISAGSKQDY